MDWMIPAQIGKGEFSLLTLLILVLISPRNTLTTHPENDIIPVI